MRLSAVARTVFNIRRQRSGLTHAPLCSSHMPENGPTICGRQAPASVKASSKRVRRSSGAAGPRLSRDACPTTIRTISSRTPSHGRSLHKADLGQKFRCVISTGISRVRERETARGRQGAPLQIIREFPFLSRFFRRRSHQRVALRNSTTLSSRQNPPVSSKGRAIMETSSSTSQMRS